MFSQTSRHLTWSIWLNVALVALTFSISRWIFLYFQASHQVMLAMPSDLFETVFIGFRFDLRAATIALSPLLLLGLILAPTHHYHIFKKLLPMYIFVINFLVISFSIGNYYYFETYGNHFDVFVFGLFDDDTFNVLTSMWVDYPIFIAFIFTLLLTTFLTGITKRASTRLTETHWKNRAWYITTVSLLSTIIIYLFFARGSLGTFPLKQYHANISTYVIFNKSTPNAFLALSWAHKSYKKDTKFSKVSKHKLQKQLFKVLGEGSVIARTTKNDLLINSPPNVVLALMEGMGTNLLLEDNVSNNDLLGSLRKPFKDDFLFTRFVSGTDGTINSLVMMLFHSNITSLSQGTVQNVALTGSALQPYQRAGYKVIYITGGSPTWRNLNAYLMKQGVDEFYSQIDIEDFYPKASENTGTWGVPDVYTFKFVQHIIKQNTQPVMIIILSQTNHSPFQVPHGYQLKPITVSAKVSQKMSMPREKSQKILETYQYSANALGDFIEEIKRSENNTIIAATGDHRIRNYSINYPDDLGFAHSVPFYLHIPESILSTTTYRYNPLRVGSHRDIFPTLYSFSLSNSHFTTLGGRNLLARNDIEHAVGFNNDVIITKKGVINAYTPQLLYPWLDDESLQVSPNSTDYKGLDYAKEYKQLQTLFINSQVAGFKP